MKKSTLILIIFLIIFLIGYFFYQKNKLIYKTNNNIFLSQQNNIKGRIQIKEAVLDLEIADTQELRTRGLSGRQSIAATTGMLFVFDSPDKYTFWMKDMNFPIDIIWMNDKFEIIYIKENAKPFPPVEFFTPNLPAKYVLETNAGFVQIFGIKVGDIAKILK